MARYNQTGGEMSKSLICLMLVFGLIGFGATRIVFSGRSQIQTDGTHAKNIEKGATLVQDEVMSDKQREHSKLFLQYNQMSRGKSLLDRKTKSGHVRYIIERGPKFISPELEGLTAEQILKQQACEADTIVICMIEGKSSQLTEDKSFIFTDYDVTIEEVLKVQAPSAISSNNRIVVTRLGGKVKVNGRVIEAIDTKFLPLDVGNKYLLFLKYVSSAGVYLAYSSEGSFLLQNDKVAALSNQSLIASQNGMPTTLSSASMLNNIRSSISAPCNK